MERSEVLDLYDDGYAAAYDDRFLLAQWPKVGADFEATVLQRILDETAELPAAPGGRWLDVGCGTGYFLSLFPGVVRGGLDLSPSMAERARAANPDVVIREGDFRDDVEEWHDAWDVVSCMWTAYNYVDSVWEVERLVANMVRWASPGGSVFIPVMDLEDLRHIETPYEEEPGEWGGTIALTSVTWTWHEPLSDKVHHHLVAPHVGHFVRLLEPHFERIEVVRYPLFNNGGPSRKAVVGFGKRAPQDGATAEVIWHPPHLPVPEPEAQPEPGPDVEPAPAPEPEPEAAAGVVEAAVESVDASVPADAPPPERPIGELPSGMLLRELGRRFGPWSPRFWRGLRRTADEVRARRRVSG